MTELGYNIKVNKDSTLRRRWFVVNDSDCPVLLLDAGVRPMYSSGRVSGEYLFQPQGGFRSLKSLRAVEVRFMLFDLWGNHMQTLSLTSVRDMGADVGWDFAGLGSWRAWENDVRDLYTVVTFVANARTTRRAVVEISLGRAAPGSAGHQT